METTTNKNIENLSPAEIEMITLQREKQALLDKENELRHRTQLEKEISGKEKEIAQFIQHWNNQNYHANSYLVDLKAIDSEFQIVVTPRTKTFEVKDYKKIDDDKKEYVAIWTKNVEYNDITIIHGDIPNKTIEISEHKVSSGHYSSSTTNNGFKMKFQYGDDRYTKDPKNMASKFTEILNKRKSEIRAKQIEASAKDMAFAKLTEKYPTATITHKSEWQQGYRGYNKRNSTPGHDHFFYTVMFPNGYGIKVTYGIYMNELFIRYENLIRKTETSNELHKDNEILDSFITALQNIK